MSVDRRELPREVRMTKWLRNGKNGALNPESDELSSEDGGYGITTDHDTYIDLIASADFLSGKTFHIKDIIITNHEAYTLYIEVFDGTSVIGQLYVASTATFGFTDFKGLKATTSVTFKSQSGTAWSAGTSVRVGGYYRTT